MSSGKGPRSTSLVKGKAAALVEKRERQSPRKSEAHVKESVSNELSWDAPFDLQGIPTALREKLVLLAPCLLGRAKAVYDQEFFHRVVGLCKEGCSPKEVTESMVPASLYEDDWPHGEGANRTRYLIEKCRDLKAREAYLRMYQLVYGDSPDNKAFSQTFLRACVFYHQDNGRKNKVNWAAAAAKVTEERQNHAQNNPLKLGPPGLKQQLVGIVKECCQYFIDHDGLHQGGSGDASVRKVDELMKEVTQRSIDLHGKEKSISELKVACEKWESRKLQLETEDERLNAMKDELRRKSKDFAKAGNPEEKARVDKEQRLITKKIAANDDKLEAAQESAARMNRTLADASKVHFNAQQMLEQLQKKVAIEKAAQYSIKPKKPAGNEWLEAGAAPQIQVDAPCASCSLLFVSNGAVPFSCGCLFHPWCLWPELLSGRRSCPRCKKLGDRQWLELWGFDVLETPTRNLVSKAPVVPESSSSAGRKREATYAAEGQPAHKLTKRTVQIKGPSPLGGKATSRVPEITSYSSFITLPMFLSRPRGNKYTEAVAAAVEYLAEHTNKLAAEAKKAADAKKEEERVAEEQRMNEENMEKEERKKQERKKEERTKLLEDDKKRKGQPGKPTKPVSPEEDSDDKGEEIDEEEEGMSVEDDKKEEGKELQGECPVKPSTTAPTSPELEVEEEGSSSSDNNSKELAPCLSGSATSASADLDVLVDAL